jgi:hypothetical protein
MARLQVTHRDNADAEAFAGPVSAERLRWSGRLSPPDFPLRLVLADLDADGTLTWPREHPEEGIYVVFGGLEVAGVECPAGGALVLEAGVPAAARATAPTQVVYVSPAPASRAADEQRAGRCVHVVGPDGWFRSGDRENVEATWFADST